MRAELIKLLDRVEGKRPEDVVQQVALELEGVSTFEYAELKDELQIGGIYIRIFNQLGLEKGAMRHVQNTANFVRQLTEFLARCINCSKELPSGWAQIKLETSDDSNANSRYSEAESVPLSDRRFVQVITAFRNVVRVDGIVDDVLTDQSMNLGPVLLSLLELPQDSEVSILEILCFPIRNCRNPV